MNVAIKLFGIIAVQIALSAKAHVFAIPNIGVMDIQQDSIVLSPSDSLKIVQRLNVPHRKLGVNDTLPIGQMEALPYVSLQQSLKGRISGIHIQEHSGEPGTPQTFYLRGISAPVLSTQSTVALQPQVYLNGIPLTTEHPFIYDIQQYHVNRIGPSSNLLAGININNIESIEVIKDPATLAKLGPMAANGAIYITSKNAKASTRDMAVNLYSGFVTRPAITPVNAYYENKFRAPFYAQYASIDDRLKYPSFLADSTNLNYYGPTTWQNTYFRNAPVQSADVSLSGGSSRANFRFFAGYTSSAGNSDETKLDAYNAAFFINMAPFTWMSMTSMLNGTLLDRDRNRNFRDRFAEMRYVPNMSVPIPPNEGIYQNLLTEYDKAIDQNRNNLIQGNIALNFNVANWRYSSRVSFDYNEGLRNAFYPSTLLEGNNYMSSYYGYSQRIIFGNVLNYDVDFDLHSSLRIEAGHELYFDTYRYNYTYGYRGPSDFIKVIVVEGDPNKSGYLQPQGVEAFRNTDKERINMSSFYGNVNYRWEDLNLMGTIRTDGVSNMPPDGRWQVSGGVGTNYTLVKDPSSQGLSFLMLNGGWGKLGRNTLDDRYAVGPQYRVDIGWGQAVNLPSYNGFPVVSRPYSQGWVGYGIKWPYTLRTDLGVSTRFLQDRLSLDVQLYQRDDKSQIMANTVAQEYGYSYELVNGLDVRNRGVDISIGAEILPKQRPFGWSLSVNAGLNTNELLALPNDQQSIVLNNKKLVLGERIDRFWLLQGAGAYATVGEVPRNPSSGDPLSINGVALGAGDPQWIDQNNDYIIDANDKVLSGQLLPKVSGGLHNSFTYQGFDLSFDLYYAVGHSALNERASNVYNFINLESSNSLSSVKEIFSWQQDVDINRYPVYNPWSSSDPYQLDQELFLEKLDFLKLRALTLGYDFKNKIVRNQENVFNRAYVYITGANLFTLTKFSGLDPELVSAMGHYDGYGLSIPRTFSLGIKLNF